MAKRTKKNVQIEHNEVSVPVIYANDIGIAFSDTEVIISFGTSAPSYFEPHDVTETPGARIALLWETAEGLMELLQKAVSRHRKSKKTAKGQKVKSLGRSGK